MYEEEDKKRKRLQSIEDPLATMTIKTITKLKRSEITYRSSQFHRP